VTKFMAQVFEGADDLVACELVLAETWQEAREAVQSKYPGRLVSVHSLEVLETHLLSRLGRRGKKEGTMAQEKFLEWVEGYYADGYLLDLAKSAIFYADECGTDWEGVVEFLEQEYSAVRDLVDKAKSIRREEGE
jgi:hypothetical protein